MRLAALLVAAGCVLTSADSAYGQQVKGAASAPEITIGTGTLFIATDAHGNEVRLLSEVPIRLSMFVVPGSVIYIMRENLNPAVQEAAFTISGLGKNKFYFLRQEGFVIARIRSSPDGSIQFTQDISTVHAVVVTDRPGSVFIRPDGTVDPSTAPISRVGNTYTLSANLTEPLIIQRSGVIIDGNNKSILGSGQTSGIEAGLLDGITVKDIRVEGFAIGGFLAVTNSAVLRSTFSANVFVGAIVSNGVVAFNACNPAFPEIPPAPGVFIQSCNLVENSVFSGNGTTQLVLEAGFFDQIRNNAVGPGVLGIGILVSSVKRTLFFGNQVLRSGRTGIQLNTSNTNALIANTISTHTRGIFFEEANSGNVVSSNTINGNSSGVFIRSDAAETIKNNLFSLNTRGVQLESVSAITISNNRFEHAFAETGVSILSARDITVAGNDFQAGGVGISASMVGCVVSSNVFRSQGTVAMVFTQTTNCKISDNAVDSGRVGIELRSSSNSNDIFQNNFRNNVDFGIRLEGGQSNKIFHNNFQGNGANASLVSAGPNTWNLPFPDGGNHWDDFTSPDLFSGESQNKPFPGGDGIVDVPNVLAASNRDNVPFVNPNGWLFIDRVPPAKITDLAATASQETSITLEWTAPGDDGAAGTAREYEIRFSQTFFLPFQFLSQTLVPNPPVPLPAGSKQTVTVGGLVPATTFYFAIRAIDEFDNKGPVSGVAQGVTRPDTTPSDPVTDLQAEYGSVRQISPAVVIEPFNSEILLTWSTPFDNSAVTGFQVFRSTEAGQEGAQIALVDPAALPAPVKAALGGRNFFVDPAAAPELASGVTAFYAIRPVDAGGNIQAVGNNISSRVIDKIAPTLEAALAPSATNFFFSPGLNALVTRRLPSAQEASFNLIKFQDEGLSGGFFKAALLIGANEVFIASGAFTDSTVSFSSPAFAANSATPGLSAVGGDRTGCLGYVVVDRAGNRASSSLMPTNCLRWDGTPPAAFLTLAGLDPAGTGPATLEIDTNEPLSAPPEVTIRQSGSTVPVTVVFSSAATGNPQFFEGVYTVLSGFDGDVNSRVRAVDLAGNAGIDQTVNFSVETDGVLLNARAFPEDPATFNPALGTAGIFADVAGSPLDVVLEIFTPDEGAVVRNATFTAVAVEVFFQWDGKDTLGNNLKDGSYVFRLRAFQPGTNFTTPLGLPQGGLIRMVRSVTLGGRSTFPNLISGSFPTTSISVTPVIDPIAGAAALGTSPGFTVASAIYDIQPDGVIFDPPITLEICLPPVLPPNPVLGRFSPPTGPWVILPELSQTATCITVRITELSLYALLVPSGAVPLTVSLELNPNTLNLKSQGNFISAFIEVTGSKTAADIDPLSLRVTKVNDQALASPILMNQETAGKSGKLKHVNIGDNDADGVPDLGVKFDRAALIAVLPVDEQVKITIEGAFKDGTPISMDDLIRTINPGLVSASMGWKYRHSHNAGVDIPPSALAQDLEISIVKLSAQPPGKRARQDEQARAQGLKAMGSPFEFGPEGTNFPRPVALSLPYDPSTLPAGAAENDLRVAYWNPKRMSWESLASRVDPAERTVSADTEHFSLYQVMAPAQPEVAAVSTAFALDEIYCFPNPARGGKAPTFHVETGMADRVELRIYDVAGELVHEAELTGAPRTIDDGQGPQLAYEYIWPGRIASGVYIYAVTVHNGGQSARRTGRCAVVR